MQSREQRATQHKQRTFAPPASPLSSLFTHMRVGPRRHSSLLPTPAMAVAHAPQHRRGVLLLLLVAALVAALPATCAAARSKKSYKAIFSFGDSLSDAGNLIVNGTPKALTTARPPYGMTFFRKPTGRCSNGRLVVDFLGTVPYSFFPTQASVFISLL